MIVMGIDPGVTTGIVVFDASKKSILSLQELKGDDAVLEELHNWPLDVVVLEDFLGSGMRNAAIVATIKQIGFVRGVVATLSRERPMTVVMQWPQRRLAFETRAKAIVKGKHVVSAMAHVLAYLDKVGQYGNAT